MKKLLCILFLMSSSWLVAQDSTSVNPQWSFNGYLKTVETIHFDNINNTNTSGHLLHNRLNLKFTPTQNLFFVGELRNRFFYGEAGAENKKPVLKSEVERLYADWQKKKWNIRVGRQRVNWGMAAIWNPNDILNAYNFLDVDYEEKPGNNAIRLQYNTNDFSHVEFVQSGLGKNQITAVQYFINHKGYDFQWIAGNYKGQPTLGMGWAGNILDAGFKGEAQYYFNKQVALRQLNFTMGLDYMFKKGWYINTGMLYNSNGLDKKIEQGQYLNLQLSAKNLMPTKYNMLLMFQKEINPLSAFSLTTIYAPKADLFILMPSLKYSLRTNLDADIIWQSLYLNKMGYLKNYSQMGFLRLRWSFGIKN
jgi:hypothetical protein